MVTLIGRQDNEEYERLIEDVYATVEESDLEREYNERFAGMDSQDPNQPPFEM